MKPYFNPRSPLPADAVVSKNLREMIATRASFGDRIAFLQQMGDSIGVTYQQIQKYERGANRLSAGRLWQFAKFFGCEVGDFYKGVDK